MPDPQQVEQIIDLGIAGILVFALIGGFFGWWIYGPIHRAIVRDLKEDRDFWRRQALTGTRVIEKVAGIESTDE